jgi:hypothetical protein
MVWQEQENDPESVEVARILQVGRMGR